MTEKSVQNDLISKLCRDPVRLLRNNVGSGFQGIVSQILEGDWVLLKKFRRVKFGLFKGSSDLIGWKTVEITQDMVGDKVAVFVGIEVKKPGKRNRTTGEQKNFINQVVKSGGIALVVTSKEEAQEGLGV